jgi:hypothetical protein
VAASHHDATLSSGPSRTHVSGLNCAKTVLHQVVLDCRASHVARTAHRDIAKEGGLVRSFCTARWRAVGTGMRPSAGPGLVAPDRKRDGIHQVPYPRHATAVQSGDE